jgi:hypothetical protein
VEIFLACLDPRVGSLQLGQGLSRFLFPVSVPGTLHSFCRPHRPEFFNLIFFSPRDFSRVWSKPIPATGQVCFASSARWLALPYFLLGSGEGPHFWLYCCALSWCCSSVSFSDCLQIVAGGSRSCLEVPDQKA